MSTLFLLLVCLAFHHVSSESANFGNDSFRDQRFLPIFQVITFNNDICPGSGTRNGTCFTANECSSKGGSSSGLCASGFGVCCIFSLSCGSTSSENCTYLVQTTTMLSTCAYTICKSSSDICRIRFDFTTFIISDPVNGLIGSTDVTRGALGDCTNDQFSITSPGNMGSPIICGFNTGQHMIVDASNQCHNVVFNLGGGTGQTRSWDIKMTQFTCNQELGGPEGCLQYFIGTSGTISSFNFPTTAAMVGATTTHLSNQFYKMCIRRQSGFCAICYVPNFADSATANAATTQAGFGLSSATIASSSGVGSECSEDYISIPGALNLIGGTTLSMKVPSVTQNRFCGQIFSAVTGTKANAAYDPAIAAMMISVCSQTRPFEIAFRSNGDESMIPAREDATIPGGIIGFSLNYQQIPC